MLTGRGRYHTARPLRRQPAPEVPQSLCDRAPLGITVRNWNWSLLLRPDSLALASFSFLSDILHAALATAVSRFPSRWRPRHLARHDIGFNEPVSSRNNAFLQSEKYPFNSLVGILGTVVPFGIFCAPPKFRGFQFFEGQTIMPHGLEFEIESAGSVDAICSSSRIPQSPANGGLA